MDFKKKRMFLRITNQKCILRGSNPRGLSPLGLKSSALTTRPRMLSQAYRFWKYWWKKKISHAGIWTRVLRVRAAYPNQLDYAGTTKTWVLTIFLYVSGVKAVSYDKIGTIQRRLAWPLRKDDTTQIENVSLFCTKKKNLYTKAGRGDRTPDLPLTKRLPCHLAIPAHRLRNHEKVKNDPRGNRTPNLRVWNPTRYHCAMESVDVMCCLCGSMDRAPDF